MTGSGDNVAVQGTGMTGVGFVTGSGEVSGELQFIQDRTRFPNLFRISSIDLSKSESLRVAIGFLYLIAENFFKEESVDGALIGGASLDGRQFANIINIFNGINLK